jgi:hypothetical protein
MSPHPEFSVGPPGSGTSPAGHRGRAKLTSRIDSYVIGTDSANVPAQNGKSEHAGWSDRLIEYYLTYLVCEIVNLAAGRTCRALLAKAMHCYLRYQRCGFSRDRYRAWQAVHRCAARLRLSEGLL